MKCNHVPNWAKGLGQAALAVCICMLLLGVTQAQIRITEVAPWGSGNSPLGSDWFELTNIGGSSVDITGWRMNDDTADFASGAPLVGVTSLAAGESAIFLEDGDAGFKNLWFGAPNVPASLQIGTYSMSGVGLSSNGDAVSIFESRGAQQAIVTFGASPTGPYPTFDNSAGLDNVLLTQLSAVGVNGAFAAANDNQEIGSPGSVPEPTALALLTLGAVVLGCVRRRCDSPFRRFGSL